MAWENRGDEIITTVHSVARNSSHTSHYRESDTPKFPTPEDPYTVTTISKYRAQVYVDPTAEIPPNITDQENGQLAATLDTLDTTNPLWHLRTLSVISKTPPSKRDILRWDTDIGLIISNAHQRNFVPRYLHHPGQDYETLKQDEFVQTELWTPKLYQSLEELQRTVKGESNIYEWVSYLRNELKL